MGVKTLAVFAALGVVVTVLTGSGWAALVIGIYAAAWMLGRFAGRR